MGRNPRVAVSISVLASGGTEDPHVLLLVMPASVGGQGACQSPCWKGTHSPAAPALRTLGPAGALVRSGGVGRLKASQPCCLRLPPTLVTVVSGRRGLVDEVEVIAVQLRRASRRLVWGLPVLSARAGPCWVPPGQAGLSACLPVVMPGPLLTTQACARVCPCGCACMCVRMCACFYLPPS